MCQKLCKAMTLFNLPYIFILLTILSFKLSPTFCVQFVDYDGITIEESGAQSRTESYESPTTANDGVVNEDSVKYFLGKFGYLRPADWNGISPRFINSGFGILTGAGDLDIIEDNFIPYKSDGLSEGSGVDEEIFGVKEDVVLYKPLAYNDISHEDYQNALMKYQKVNGLAMTGTLDVDTLEFMEKPRCGVPDRTASLKSNETTIVSLPDKFNENLPAGSTNDPDEETSGDEDEDHMERKKRSTWDDIQVNFDMSSFEEADDMKTMFSIPEAEPSEDSRVKSLERALMALRNASSTEELMNDIEMEMDKTPPTPPKTPDLIHRAMLHARRKKRSYIISKPGPHRVDNPNGWLIAYSKPIITWRLVREWPSSSPYLPTKEVRFTIKLAFRMWSEVLPRTFVEDNTSPMSHVDILIGFGKKRHNRCPVEFFDSQYTNEYAHAWPLPKAEIHFNDDQAFRAFELPKHHFSDVYSPPISLVKVAVHEIGHTLGLPHTKHDLSIMNPVYRAERTSKSFELSFVDRILIQKIYGSCENPFDVVFDWVRPFQTPSGRKYKYNTFFFRKSWHWLYENQERRPRYGDPRLIEDKFKGVMTDNDPYGKIDAIVQVRGWGGFAGPTYIFKGNKYIEYDTATERTFVMDVKGNPYPRPIFEGFPGVPYPLDTAIYKYDEKLLYFFKGEMVYKFDFGKKRVVAKNKIRLEFPGWGGAAPLPSNLDAAYYSYTDYSYYFFKGIHYWRMADKRDVLYNKGESIPKRAVGPRQVITSKWKDLCDVHETELDLGLPKTI